jgi:uncharacterized protein (UPF0332 family)
MADGIRYLRKARESLASAEADASAKRYNSAANRSYYAAFQAAVAALIHTGIRPDNNQWQHRFVNSQFSGRLIGRWKLLENDLPAMLDDLFRIRVVADYESSDVSRPDGLRSVRNARQVVDEVDRLMKLHTPCEASAEYDTQVAEEQPLLQRAASRVAEIRSVVLVRHPEAHFDVSRLGPKDHRLNVYIKDSSFGGLSRTLGSISTDILLSDDLWIVVIPHNLRELELD